MKAKRLLALVLSCCLCSSASAALAAPKNTDTQQFHRVFDAATVSRYSHFTDKTYVLPSGYTIYDGIDVSSKDGTIHWNTAAKDGIAFALIQVGNRGVKSGDLFQDEMYTAYMDGAAAADIPVGVTFSSQALDTAEAEEEARFVLEHVKRDNVQLPIVMNYAYYDGSGRLEQANLSQSQKTANVLAFCGIIRDAGYQPMLCASRDFLTNDIYTEQIKQDGVQIGVAHYTTQTSCTGYTCWQYTGSGRVNGVSSDVSCNFYLTTGDLIPKHTVCGFQDVLSSDWFAPAVSFVFRNNLMNGNSPTQFAPHAALTRAMVAQVLYNFSGRPAVTQAASFSDVSDDQWFAKAVAWAQQNDIMADIQTVRLAPIRPSPDKTLPLCCIAIPTSGSSTPAPVTIFINIRMHPLFLPMRRMPCSGRLPLTSSPAKPPHNWRRGIPRPVPSAHRCSRII